MTTMHDNAPTVWVMHRSTGGSNCRFCRHPIRHYDEVGWVDITSAFYGGSYDMCAQSCGGQHEPI